MKKTKKITKKSTVVKRAAKRARKVGKVVGRTGWPVVPLRDLVVFPHLVVPLLVGRERSMKAVEAAAATGDGYLLLLTQRKPSDEDPGFGDVYKLGTLVKVLQSAKAPDGSLKVLVEGKKRVVISGLEAGEGYLRGVGKEELFCVKLGKSGEAMVRSLLAVFEKHVNLNSRLSPDAIFSVNNVEDAEKLTSVIAAHLTIKIRDKQKLLEISDCRRRIEALIRLILKENDLLALERKIQGRVRESMSKSQKDYYLQEQMKAIQKEMGGDADLSGEVEELKQAMDKAALPAEVAKRAGRELGRMAKMMPMSAEAAVIRTYLEWILDLPWNKLTKDRLDLKRAECILDEDHHDMEKAKERIVEHLAVCKLTKRIRGPILCFVGPPGVGKTSLAKSIARAMDRKFARASLGGVRDEAEIRGHRRTYIGALPGKIIQLLKKAGSSNPVMLLDEIDKLGADFRGDPAAALLEALDPEQNSAFNDHYMDLDFDLSGVMFITTANVLHTVPAALHDRMEVIRLPGYTSEEKLKIAEKFLLPKLISEHGLSKKQLAVGSAAIRAIITNYTREAGVRNLERELATICRKVAKQFATRAKGRAKGAAGRAHSVEPKSLRKYLGVPKFKNSYQKIREPGVATGLAWTEFGGELLTIEVNIMPGKGKLILTGKLGEVLQESAQAALSYVRACGPQLGLARNFFDRHDIHVHIPEGAVPKDGPSAGVAIGVALFSAVCGRPPIPDLAMTGELTLRGRVLKIGGLKEKVLAAKQAGINTVLLPEDNSDELSEVPAKIKQGMKFLPVNRMEKVLRLVFGKKLFVSSGKRAGKSRAITGYIEDRPAH